MADLESLLNDLANLNAQHDLDGLRRVREQIVTSYPDSEHAVEALYKIGLDLLFRQRDLDRAVERFAEAAKRKHLFWSNAARTSLGLCYFHQKRSQKALFELRKVAYQEPPSSHSVTALSFIETIFMTEGNAEEVIRARKDRISQLQKLCKQGAASTLPQELGYYLFSLGIALKDSGDDQGAKDALERAKALGEAAVGLDLYRSILNAL